MRAGNEENEVIFSAWKPNQPYPSSSVPAQVAARCAAQQGTQTFEKYHMAVFKAFFTECQNIYNRDILLNLAQKTNLDIEKFASSFDNRYGFDEIMAEHEYYQQNFLGWGIPFAMVDGRYPVVGGVPITMYQRTINLALGKMTLNIMEDK